MQAMTRRRKVLVGGATGNQGSAVAHLLLERGYEVVAYVRSSESPKAVALATHGAKLAIGDLADRGALAQAASDVDAMFSITFPFGKGGAQAEVEQGQAIANVAAARHLHLIYSSMSGIEHRTTNQLVEHASSKQTIEAYMDTHKFPLTILAPGNLMENLLNFDSNGLRHDTYAQPLSPQRKLDQVTVLDIAGMAVYALEHPEELVGKRMELASDYISGEEIVSTLSEVIGRPIRYVEVPLEQIRERRGEEIAKMFQNFENNPYTIDIAALHAQYPAVQWHTFRQWALTIDWKTLLPPS